MSKFDTAVRMLVVACAGTVFAQGAAAEQPDALDFTPPVLGRLDVFGSVNAQSLNQSVSVTVKLTDNLSGVASFLVDFRSPSGQHHVSRQKIVPEPRTRVQTEMTLGALPFSDVPFLRFAEPGIWTAYSLTTTDGAGNTRTYNESELRGRPGIHTFSVTNTGGYDIVPPAFVSGEIDTLTVRLSKEPPGRPEGTPPYASGRVNLTDSGNGIVSGVYSADLMFCMPNTGACAGGPNTFTMHNVVNRAGLSATTLAMGTQLAPNQLAGNYVIYSLEMRDAAGSHTKLLSSDFSGGNFNFHPGFPQGVAIFVNQ